MPCCTPRSPHLSVHSAEARTGPPPVQLLCLQLCCTWTGVHSTNQRLPTLPHQRTLRLSLTNQLELPRPVSIQGTTAKGCGGGAGMSAYIHQSWAEGGTQPHCRLLRTRPGRGSQCSQQASEHLMLRLRALHSHQGTEREEERGGDGQRGESRRL
jgi:hypothetical protein